MNQAPDPVALSKSRRNKSYWFGSLTAMLVIAVFFGVCLSEGDCSRLGMGAILALLSFTFVSCLCLANNCILDVVAGISGWSLRMPGLIFSLDLDGIIWFLTVKLAFWILGIIASILCFLLAVAVGGILSVFVYPFAIRKSIAHPDAVE